MSGTRHTYDSNGTGWFVGIILAVALLAIGYLVFSANSGPAGHVARRMIIPGAVVVAFDGATSTYRNPSGECIVRTLDADTELTGDVTACPRGVTMAMDAGSMTGAFVVQATDASSFYKLPDGQCVEETHGEGGAYYAAVC